MLQHFQTFILHKVKWCWWQWLCGLRHEPSSVAGMLGSWVRIPLKGTDVCVYVYSVSVLFCVQALRWADQSSKESCRLRKKDYETEEEARAQHRAVEPLMNEWKSNDRMDELGFGRRQSWPNCCTILEFSWRDQVNPQKTSVGVLAKIQTWHFPNTGLECYYYQPVWFIALWSQFITLTTFLLCIKICHFSLLVSNISTKNVHKSLG
jgi:hypothetical protein